MAEVSNLQHPPPKREGGPAAGTSVLRTKDGGRLAFMCPGCRIEHEVTVGDGAPPRWTFNGDMARPTFAPSILVRGVEPITDAERDRIMAGEKVAQRPYVCHSFVTGGRIDFLCDSTHELAGKVVDLTPFEGG